MVGFHDHMAAMLDYDREKEKERMYRAEPILCLSPEPILVPKVKVPVLSYIEPEPIRYIPPKPTTDFFEERENRRTTLTHDSILRILGLNE